MRLALCVCIGILLLSSCNSGRIYEDNRDFERRSWLANDTARFAFEIPAGHYQYNIQYNLRNTIGYPYSRIFVNFVLSDSTGQVLSSKLVSNYLFDLKTGAPFGSSGLGDIYDHRFPLLTAYGLKAGKYSVTLQQFMRVDTLQGVLAAGVRVERSE
jgi:gliding motility-associated lipoprotein GldH